MLIEKEVVVDIRCYLVYSLEEEGRLKPVGKLMGDLH